jgi:ABC-type Fe3+-hydroxamate transport system substrate-binding protein
MRVVSLVPSWTETLLAAGVDVVGRTRFCIHPKERVQGISRVGGTKDWDWTRILALKPDLLILDKEENPKFMGEQTEIPFHASDVRSARDLPLELEKMAAVLNNRGLKDIAEDWREVLSRPTPEWNGEVPGLIDWGVKPTHHRDFQFLYMIWKNPWMAIGTQTFIASMFRELGLPLKDLAEPYPKIRLEDFSPVDTVLLFSSEPFPFLKHRQDLVKEGYAHGFVDGEKFSWFGVRSLKFLQLTKR